ncbi:MAG: hypothetical protein ABIT01_08975 [Thermoanaerobaculia bacterium]
MRKSPALLGIALLALSVGPAAAQTYRQGEPEVLAPAGQNGPKPGWDRLRSALAEQGSPRFVLFWDRQLDAEIATSYQERETEHVDVQAGGASSGRSVVGWNTSAGSSSSSGSLHAESSKEKRTERVGTEERPIESPTQKAFTNELRRGGLKFVDSTVAIRQAGAAVSAERPNYKAIEWQGLTRFADYLLQVTQQQEGKHRVYLVSVRNLKDGEIVVDFSSTGSGAHNTTYVATDGGFEPREADHDMRIKTVAAETAERLRIALTEASRSPRPASR